jgi:hypothetical protein
MKRLIVFFVVITLLIGNGSIAFADGTNNPAMAQKKIIVYIKPDVSVELNGVKQCFRDIQGQIVYPVIYNGCTYLPVRASSALMKEPIEWDKASKTVFIGKTISNPNKATAIISTAAAVAVSDSAIITTPKPTMDSAYLKPDILVMYDFEIQTFQDVNGDTVYPIIYNGSTYLPVRAISKLMNAPIDWDGVTKTISINDEDSVYAVVDEEKDTTKAAVEVSTTAMNLKSLFDREEVLYYEATGKASAIAESAASEDKGLIAASITDNYQKSQAMTLEIKDVDSSGFNDEEKAALDKLTAYAESTEYYVLVLENIAYLAAQDNDYSMLAETFMYFAMDSQTKMEEARSAIQALN